MFKPIFFLLFIIPNLSFDLCHDNDEKFKMRFKAFTNTDFDE